MNARNQLAPQLVPGAAVVYTGGGVLVDVGGTVIRIRGAYAAECQRIIPLLDGTLDWAGLTQALPGVPAETLTQTVRALCEAGVVQHVVPGTPTVTSNAGLLLSRLQWRTRSEQGREPSALGRRVLTIAAGAIHDPILTDLLRATFADVAAFEESHVRSLLDEARTGTVVVAAASKDDYSLFESLDEWARARDGLWMRAVIDCRRGILDVGPLFSAASPCYRCFRRGIRHIVPRGPQGQSSCATPAVFASLVTAELSDALLHASDVSAPCRLRRFQLPSLNCQEIAPIIRESCPICHPEAARRRRSKGQRKAIPPEVLLEDMVRLGMSGPLDFLTREEEQWGPRIVQDHKTAGATVVRLPAVDRLPLLSISEAMRSVTRAEGVCDLQAISALLSRTAGFHGGEARGGPPLGKRFAPTAGNLGSIRCFLVTGGCTGVDDGVYRYEPGEHGLARNASASESSALGRALYGDSRELRQAQALILITARLDRVCAKYGLFGYKLAHLDAGAALAQLEAVAAAYRLHTSVRLVEPTRNIRSSLMLERDIDIVIGYVAVRTSEGRLPSSQPRSSVRRRHAGGQQTATLRQSSPSSVLRALVRHRNNDPQAGVVPTTNESRERAYGAAVRLSACAINDMSIGEVLTRRRSVREFAPTSIELERLAFALSADVQSVSRRWSVSDPTALFVVASRVSGLDKAIYRYDNVAHELQRSGEIPEPEVWASCFVQPSLANAPCHLVGCIRPEHDWTGDSTQVYRAGLVKAANRLHRISLASQAVGLGGVFVAGVKRDHTARALFLNRHEIPVVGIAMGYPASGLSHDIAHVRVEM